MGSEGVQVLFGTFPVGNRDPFIAENSVNTAFSILEAHHVKHLDSAQAYGQAEQKLGELKAGNRFTIDTKWKGGLRGAGWSTRENIVNSAKESLQKLGVEQVDVFYLHAPDPGVDIEETLAGVDEVYKSGAFKRFGLSNYLVADVQKIYNVCKAKGYVLPTVYQGNYSASIGRGFLTKTPQQVQEGAGRFSKEAFGGRYRDMYMKPSYLEALVKWDAVAAGEGISPAELAYRWITHNSALKEGDGVVIGVSSIEQLELTLKGIEKGKLSEEAAKAIDGIWDSIKHEAPLDNFH